MSHVVGRFSNASWDLSGPRAPQGSRRRGPPVDLQHLDPLFI